MADLFTVTAPLRVLVNKKTSYVIAECYPHPNGLVYIDLFWNEALENNNDSCIHLIEAELKGEGPWKIAGNIIYVLGCRGTDAALATDYASWTDYCQVTNMEGTRKLLNQKLSDLGVATKFLHDSKVISLY